jgi:hypothetical protein
MATYGGIFTREAHAEYSLIMKWINVCAFVTLDKRLETAFDG